MILFDDLDLLCRSPLGVESDPYQEGSLSHKVVDCLVDLLAKERQRGTACVLVATAETKEDLHPRLVGSQGGQHVFGKVAVLHPPSAVCVCGVYVYVMCVWIRACGMCGVNFCNGVMFVVWCVRVWCVCSVLCACVVCL